MQIISPDTLARIGERIILIGAAVQMVEARRSIGNFPRLQAGREGLAASEADYEKAMSELDPDQHEWVENLFSTALTLARDGKDGYTQAVYKAQIKWADDQIRELETITTELKDARSDWVKAAMFYDVPAYQIAKLCERTPSTVQRWVK